MPGIFLCRLWFWIGGLSWLAGISGASASNWPGFRGPAGDGVAELEKAPTHFGRTNNLLWKAEIPVGHSSPVIWKGRLFLTSAEGNTLNTFCLDGASGRQLWKRTNTVEKLEPMQASNSAATSTPATDGVRLYVYFASLGLIAYDLEGKELWRKSLPMPKSEWGTGTSPILAGGKLVLFVQVGKDSHLLMLNPANGEEIRKAAMPEYNSSYATPVYWKEKDRACVGMVCARRFTAFDLADGKEVWWVTGLGFQACSTPVVSGDRLLVTAAGIFGEANNMLIPPTFEEALKKYGRKGEEKIAYEDIPDELLFVDRHTSDGQGNMTLKRALAKYFRLKKGDKVSAKEWGQIRQGITGFRGNPVNRMVVMSVRTGGKQDVTDSQILWKETKGVPEVPSPLAWHGRLYLIRSGGILVCRDLETGKLVYEERIDSLGGYFASPILVDGRIYVASDRGTVTVLKPGDVFEVLARTELGEPIIASPAVSDNILYIRSSRTLWAFGEKSR